MKDSQPASIPAETLARIMALDGGIDADECALYAEARNLREGCIVEIGSYRGRSTAALALGTLAGFNVPVYAIEPHETFTGAYGGRFGPADRAIFFKNMLALGIAETVRLVSLSSEYVTEIWPMPVGLLWVDGDHTLRGVQRDIVCWHPHLRPDAVIIFDDATNPRMGPFAVIEEMLSGVEWVHGPSIGKTVTLFRRIAQEAVVSSTSPVVERLFPSGQAPA
jgi:hypothetical protein